LQSTRESPLNTQTREALQAQLAARDRELAEARADRAAMAIENARLSHETQQALERQTATADILKVIANSPSDTRPVFDAIALVAARLLGANSGVFACDETAYWPIVGAIGGDLIPLYGPARAPIDIEANFPSRAIVSGQTYHVPDWSRIDLPDVERRVAEQSGFNSTLYLPLMKHAKCIGLLSFGSVNARHFGHSEIALAESFRDQALIAIENARLFTETREALERQTATAEILKVIASSPSDTAPVFDAIAANANRLLHGLSTAVWRFEGEVAHLAAFTPTNPEADAALRALSPMPIRDLAVFVLVKGGEITQLPDTEQGPERLRDLARLRGYRAMLFAPLLQADEAVGFVSVTRKQPGAFDSDDVSLLKTFADQASIAIQNTRLFNETQEALERQTATSEILRVISRSPTDAKPVFESIVVTAARLLRCDLAFVMLTDGRNWWNAAVATPEGQLPVLLPGLFPVDAKASFPARAILAKAMLYLPDWSTIEVPEHQRRVRDAYGTNASLHLPFMREGECIGLLTLTSKRAHPFGARDIAQAESFRDQALIAMENARLFDETQEALQQQTATADVLKVISRSVFDLDMVLQTLIDTAVKLTNGSRGTIFIKQGDVMVARAFHRNVPDALRAYLVETTWRIDGDSHMAKSVRDGVTIHVPDLSRSEKTSDKQVKERAAFGAGLWAPLMRDGKAIGVLGVPREAPVAFTDREIELVQTFADQAVIAIENVRLFNEVKTKTDDLSEALRMQTATSDVLKVISRSAFDLQAVFNTLITSAVELSGAFTGTICVRDGDVFRYRDTVGADHTPALGRYLREHPATPGRGTIAGRVLLSGKVERIPDCLADPDYVVPMGALASSVRSLLGVPLLRNDGVEGAIILTRMEAGSFTDRQIEIVQTFADQAVIAIENVRLFDEVQARTRELAASLDDLRKAQDRLVQSEKLASLGQLTAGIAHEIKNPLNFINNFSALSRELLDELREVLDKAPLEADLRDEAEDLVGMVTSNLDKVVIHGKRADSIVKNMLLHSREGSGERSTINVNAMVEEALNLAYHGARAEKPGFNVTIAKALDPNAGAADLHAQEMTRVLLNLISNGFHATTKRGREESNGAWEPTITASTRDLGDRVEIAIRDNGTGVTEEVKAKMFNPFFTTKPAGEGTGLGLSLSHDIVVKQHGGTIEVTTEPGAFTQFTIVLPRKGAGS